jgi:hypothetical protein
MLRRRVSPPDRERNRAIEQRPLKRTEELPEGEFIRTFGVPAGLQPARLDSRRLQARMAGTPGGLARRGAWPSDAIVPTFLITIRRVFAFAEIAMLPYNALPRGAIA